MSKKLIYNECKKKLHSSDLLNVIIITLLTFLIFGLPVFEHSLRWHTDAYFHLSRIHDITQSIKHCDIPNALNLNSFGNSGQAINGMYPYFTLLPFIAITAWMNPISQYAMINLLFILVGSIVNYFVFQKFNRSKIQSLSATIAFFPLINVFSAYHLSLQGVWGIYFILPLALLCMKEINAGQKKYIIFFAMSVAALINLHLISALLTISLLFFVFLYLLFTSNSKKDLFINYTMSAILGFLLSLPTLLNILFFSGSNLTTINQTALSDATMTLSQMIQSLNNLSLSGTSIPELYGYALILDIIIVTNWHKFSQSKAKTILVTTFILQVIITPYFPWAAFQHTPISIIQFPNRILPIILTLQILVVFTTERLNTKNFLVVLTIGSIFFAISHTTTNLNEKNKMFEVTHMMISRAIYDKNHDIDKNISKINDSVLNDNDFYNLIGYREYIPRWASSNHNTDDTTINKINDAVIKHRFLINNKVVYPSKLEYGPNQITYAFSQPKNGVIIIPFWDYKNIHYTVLINGQPSPHHTSATNTLLINSINVRSITVKVTNPTSNVIGLVFGSIVWVAATIFVIISRLLFKKIS